jgi:hypothetical protein
MARKHNQYSVAKGCTELQGKYLAMFTDRMQTENTTRQRELSEAEQEEAKAIARIRLNELYGLTSNEGTCFEADRQTPEPNQTLDVERQAHKEK